MIPVIYFATPSGKLVCEAIARGELAAITTPKGLHRVDNFPLWAADNSCGPGRGGVSGGLGADYPGDVPFLRWLALKQPHAGRCAFAVAPDVVCDAKATLKRSLPFLPVIRGLGYKAAFAAQNGLERLRVPWDEFDVLFLGADDEWKLGPHAVALTAEAKVRGKGIHMGRVNSMKRLEYARYIGCDSADGTYLRWPDTNLPKLLGWLRVANGQELLFGGAA